MCGEVARAGEPRSPPRPFWTSMPKSRGRLAHLGFRASRGPRSAANYWAARTAASGPDDQHGRARPEASVSPMDLRLVAGIAVSLALVWAALLGLLWML